jgi:hypothetical protein
MSKGKDKGEHSPRYKREQAALEHNAASLPLPVKTIEHKKGDTKVVLERKATMKDSEHSVEHRERIAFHLPVALDPQDIMDHLSSMKRSPFRIELTKALGGAPSAAAIGTFADKHPDRWGQLVAILARLSGYTEKVEVSADLTIQAKAHTMSDHELIEAAKLIQTRLALPLEKKGAKAHDKE